MSDYKDRIAIVIRDSEIDNSANSGHYKDWNINYLNDLKNKISDRTVKKAYNDLLKMKDKDIEEALEYSLRCNFKGQIVRYHVNTKDLLIKHSILSKNFLANSYIFSKISATLLCTAFGIEDDD